MIVIDTDPGIDDAIAILFALHAGLDVAAITTVAGNIGLPVTTGNAGRILALAGRDLPVHAGASKPLARPGIDETRIHGRDGLGGVEFPEPIRKAGADAVAFLRELLTNAPCGTVDIHALGPMTNLATLIQTAPDTARRIRRIIAMGGAVDEPGNVGPRAEFNLANDPEAAQIVLASGIPLILIPLDVTRKVRADLAYLDRLRGLGTAQASACADLIAAYFTSTPEAVTPTSRPLHDPCVPLLARWPDLFTLQAMELRVDAEGALIPGPHRLTVAMSVDARAVLDKLMEGLT